MPDVLLTYLVVAFLLSSGALALGLLPWRTHEQDALGRALARLAGGVPAPRGAHPERVLVGPPPSRHLSRRLRREVAAPIRTRVTGG